ncbi:MAG: tetratricopeptide repeat protein [bacterium]|nr:tetratricopeptide repeat protein [bacterium]
MKKELLPFVLLVLLVGVTFANTLLNQFVYDDKVFVVNNQFIKELKNIPDFFINARSFSGDRDFMIYRPLAALSLSLDHWLWGIRPMGYHLTNITLHMANVLLVYWLVLSLSSMPLTALLSAAIFAIHPAQCETVSWIASRSNLLCTMFLLLALLAYLRNTRQYYYRSLLFFILSLLAKETAIIFILLLILYDYYFVLKVDKNKAVNMWWSYTPVVVISGLYLLLRTLVLGQVHQRGWWGGSLGYTMLTMGKSFYYYIKVIILPWKLTVDYVLDIAKSIQEPLALGGVGLVLAIIILALKASRKEKLITFGLFWFLIALLPVSNIIPLEALLAERFLYLPLVGASIAMAVPLTRLKTKWGYALITLLLVFYLVRTIQRNMDWHDDHTLWASTVITSPESPRAHFALGQVYYKEGNYCSAVHEYQAALGLNPDVAELYNVLGLAYEGEKSWTTAIAVYQAGLKAKSLTNDTKINLLLNLGNSYSHLGKPDVASAYYRKVLELEPGNAAARHNLDLIIRYFTPLKSQKSSNF